jgi:hypothetical protein
VNSADCLSVLANEKIDTFLEEQFSIGISYVYEDKIRKDFLQFDYLMNVMD